MSFNLWWRPQSCNKMIVVAGLFLPPNEYIAGLKDCYRTLQAIHLIAIIDVQSLLHRQFMTTSWPCHTSSSSLIYVSCPLNRGTGGVNSRASFCSLLLPFRLRIIVLTASDRLAGNVVATRLADLTVAANNRLADLKSLPGLLTLRSLPIIGLLTYSRCPAC